MIGRTGRPQRTMLWDSISDRQQSLMRKAVEDGDLRRQRRRRLWAICLDRRVLSQFIQLPILQEPETDPSLVFQSAPPPRAKTLTTLSRPPPLAATAPSSPSARAPQPPSNRLQRVSHSHSFTPTARANHLPNLQLEPHFQQPPSLRLTPSALGVGPSPSSITLKKPRATSLGVYPPAAPPKEFLLPSFLATAPVRKAPSATVWSVDSSDSEWRADGDPAGGDDLKGKRRGPSSNGVNGTGGGGRTTTRTRPPTQHEGGTVAR